MAQGGARAAAAGLAATGAWMFFSSALIIANKRVYAGGFPHPMFVTGVGQLATAAGGAALGRLAGCRRRSLPPLEWMRLVLAPLWGATFLTMWLGNAAYLHLSVAFIQILKAMTPAVTLLLAAAVGQESLSGSLMLSVALIAVGTGVATVLEQGLPSWSAFGVLLFAGSSVTEAARVVGSTDLMRRHHFNPYEALVYTSLPAGLLLIAASLLTEGTGALLLAPLRAGRGLAGVAAALGAGAPALNAAAALSLLVNVTSFWAMRATGALTFKVAGCLKNVAVIWYSVAAAGERVSGGQLLGYGLSVGGFLLYSTAKARRAPPAVGGRAKAKAA